ncbi:MAG TPA: hypothetical protein VFO39_21350 [Candidatus Sulfotelmatobacter sp.]|nr:hypothetical protein [Candidatus Sulfotelmatobacter sp.]
MRIDATREDDKEWSSFSRTRAQFERDVLMRDDRQGVEMVRSAFAARKSASR